MLITGLDLQKGLISEFYPGTTLLNRHSRLFQTTMGKIMDYNGQYNNNGIMDIEIAEDVWLNAWETCHPPPTP